MAHWKVNDNVAYDLTKSLISESSVCVPICSFNEKLWIRISGSVYSEPKDFELLRESIVRIVTKAIQTE